MHHFEKMMVGSISEADKFNKTHLNDLYRRYYMALQVDNYAKGMVRCTRYSWATNVNV